jgi:hypothetical protein
MFRYVAVAALVTTILSSPIWAKCYECCGGGMPDGSCSRWCQIACNPSHGKMKMVRSANQCATSDWTLVCQESSRGFSMKCNTVCDRKVWSR